jgi:Na+-transporting methylmalonyl-CoA/oxaloacetate decarboxylase gamma subunit
MKRRILIPTLIFLVVLVLAVSSVSASSPARDLPAGTEGATLVPGNYCVSCHLADDPRLALATAWTGSIAREADSPCPAATKIHEELYYTERLLLMIDRAGAEVDALPEKSQARLDGYTQRYSRMLDAPVTSMDAFVSESQTTRYQMNKAYTALNQMAEAAKQRTVLIYAGIVTLIVLGSLTCGLYNTRAIKAGIVSKSWATFWRVAFVLAVLIFFALPIFRVPAVEVEMTTEEQQAAQTTLDTAQRAADAADRAQARAWMLARVGTAWNEIDTAYAQSLLDESLAALETARENETALWGQSLAVQEVTVGIGVEMETAGLIAADLNAVRARAWALPLIAVEWNALDPVKAAALLQAGQDVVEGQSGLYRDLQLRGLALARAKVDAAQAAPTAAQIDDPSLSAWTFRELADFTGDRSLFERAAEAAREIEDPVHQAHALREIGVASGQSALFDEALVALDDVTGASLAYALSDLAVASRDASFAEQIAPAFPEARTSALLRMGEYQTAWEAAAGIVDPYEKARAQAAIASAWGNADAATRISIPLYRDLALRDVIRKSGNAALVDSISSAYYKVQALTALGNYEAASQLAGNLGDAYPLVELAVSLAEKDPQAALALVDEMTREADKAVALQAIAVASQDQALIEQAQGMALAARVRGDSLAPAQALLDLAQALWTVDTTHAGAVLQQAYEAVQRIATK